MDLPIYSVKQAASVMKLIENQFSIPTLTFLLPNRKMINFFLASLLIIKEGLPILCLSLQLNFIFIFLSILFQQTPLSISIKNRFISYNTLVLIVVVVVFAYTRKIYIIVLINGLIRSNFMKLNFYPSPYLSYQLPTATFTSTF